MDIHFILRILGNGISLSATYALLAIGLTLVFGVLRILNFAHGELLMCGGLVMWVLFGKWGAPFLPSLVAAMLVVGGLAFLVERIFFRPTRANPFLGFIISLGLVYILQVSALLSFGPVAKPLPTAFTGKLEIWGASLSVQSLVIIPTVGIVMVLVWILLERTMFGRAVRACIQDSEAASLQGICLDKMSAKVMFLAGALAGLAGGLITQTVSVGPYIGTFVILKAFVIVIVGGMGSIGGTIVAAIMFGFLDSTISSLINPRITTLVGVVLMLVVLLIKPQGLFGRV